VEGRPLSSAPAYPRDLAARVLTRVLSDAQALDESLAALVGEVSPAQRAWLQEVCAGTLRWKGRLDFALDSIALKKKPSGWLRKALLVAAYQLVGQDRTSPGAVVSETVAQVKRREGESPAKFANALLRRIADHASEWRELPFPASASAAQQAAWASLPEWLWRRLVAGRGVEWARAYAQASLERPRLWVRARAPREGWDPGPIPEAYEVSRGEGRGPLTEWEGFSAGEFFVQDISSQALVRSIDLAVRERAPALPRTALDLCAAPGGKSAGLAWNGWEVLASDRESPRLQLLEQTLTRVAPGARLLPKAEVAQCPPQTLVWVDSPCTGTGILRRHPDVRWLRQEKQLESLLRLQRELIHEGWAKVAPGGFLAYSVCSVLREEGSEAVQAAALPAEKVAEWSLEPQQPPGGDGFWCILLRKSAIS
jgi:16S rRNA (cytosine967-C5)-methyltransferase